MNEDKSSLNKDDSWWKPVMIFYVKTASWIMFPLVLSVLLGKYVKNSFGSQTLFFVFIMIGFGITCFGIYREIKEYKKGLEKNNKKK